MDNWVRILSTGGAGGVLVFAVVFLLKWSSRYMKDAPPAWRRSVILVFLGTWLVIFVAAGLIMFVWARVTIKNEIRNEAIIRGRLMGLDPTTDFKSLFDDLYLRRVDKTQSQAAFAWLIISQERLAPGRIVNLLLDGSTTQSEVLNNCEMPIKADFYGREVILKYDSKRRVLVEDGSALNCSPAPLLVDIRKKVELPPGLRFQLVPSAYAQVVDQRAVGELEAMSARLESNDAVVRLQARSDLAAAGGNALWYIDLVLSNPKSSYRLQLGTLVALNNMAAIKPNLGDEANCEIAHAANSNDSTLRDQAKKYLAKHANLHLPVGCKLVVVTPKVPLFPARLGKARSVYIAASYGSSAVDGRERLVALEDAIRKWGKLKVFENVSFADLVLKVECYPSEDILSVYDSRFWPNGPWVWHMSLKDGLQAKETLLATYFEKAFENATVR